MKTTTHKHSSKWAVLGAILISANIAFAQSTLETTTTRTTSMGTISAFTPNSITVTSSSSTAPINYTYSKTTTYVDENGNPVSIETVRSGLPVTVYYDREGDQLVASKVVVRKHVDVTSGTATTPEVTTTSTEGTVSEFSPEAMTVTTQSSSTPVSYSFTKTTTYVDENGNPVSVDVVKSGAPVTVFYDYVDGRPVASKVIVRQDAAGVESKKTTTTTTTSSPNP